MEKNRSNYPFTRKTRPNCNPRLIQLFFYRYMGIFCWIVDKIVPIYITRNFKMSFVVPRNFINDAIVLSPFRTTSQNCKRRSRSSCNNSWSNLGRYIFKAKHCLRRLKDLREVPNSIEALRKCLTHISFSWVVTLTGRPLFWSVTDEPSFIRFIVHSANCLSTCWWCIKFFSAFLSKPSDILCLPVYIFVGRWLNYQPSLPKR